MGFYHGCGWKPRVLTRQPLKWTRHSSTDKFNWSISFPCASRQSTLVAGSPSGAPRTLGKPRKHLETLVPFFKRFQVAARNPGFCLPVRSWDQPTLHKPNDPQYTVNQGELNYVLRPFGDDYLRIFEGVVFEGATGYLLVFGRRRHMKPHPGCQIFPSAKRPCVDESAASLDSVEHWRR